MKKLNTKGFTIVEALIVFVLVILTAAIALFAYGQISSKEKLTADAKKTESLEKAKKELGDKVTAEKTIPDSVSAENEVSYARKDNQTAELCASFALPRSGKSDTATNLVEVFKSYFAVRDTVHQIYRDDVDFAQHTAGRNCYVISYKPINVAYEDKYYNSQVAGSVCDINKKYESRFTGQTIQGFFIGGSFTTNPGTAGGHAVLAQDVDAFDATCKKVPVSALKVGDKVEFYIETGPVNNDDTTYFVKAIKKEF